MPHEVTKKCPFCGKPNVAIVTAALELEGGGIDETNPISLEDPAPLATTYSMKGLEMLYLATTKTGWHCAKKYSPDSEIQTGCGSYYSVNTIQATLDPKMRLAEQLCK